MNFPTAQEIAEASDALGCEVSARGFYQCGLTVAVAHKINPAPLPVYDPYPINRVADKGIECDPSCVQFMARFLQVTDSEIWAYIDGFDGYAQGRSTDPNSSFGAELEPAEPHRVEEAYRAGKEAREGLLSMGRLK